MFEGFVTELIMPAKQFVRGVVQFGLLLLVILWWDVCLKSLEVFDEVCLIWFRHWGTTNFWCHSSVVECLGAALCRVSLAGLPWFFSSVVFLDHGFIIRDEMGVKARYMAVLATNVSCKRFKLLKPWCRLHDWDVVCSGELRGQYAKRERGLH
jgi:hypothetical protein